MQGRRAAAKSTLRLVLSVSGTKRVPQAAAAATALQKIAKNLMKHKQDTHTYTHATQRPRAESQRRVIKTAQTKIVNNSPPKKEGDKSGREREMDGNSHLLRNLANSPEERHIQSEPGRAKSR